MQCLGKTSFLIQSFLKYQKQRTAPNGQSSNWGDIFAGVPLEFYSGTYIFLSFSADDTSLFTVVEKIPIQRSVGLCLENVI